jgi:hypothetical protein
LAQSWQHIDIRILRGELGFVVAIEISAITETDGVVHCDAIDTTTLSPECQQPSQPNPTRAARTLEVVVLQRFSQHSRVIERNLPKPRSWAVPARCQGSANSKTWVRQLCAKGQIRRSHPPTKRRRDDRPVINPPTANGPIRTRSNGKSLAGRPRRTLSPECQQPSHESVRNPVKNPVRNPPTAGQTQRPRTRPCLPAGDTRKKRTSK